MLGLFNASDLRAVGAKAIGDVKGIDLWGLRSRMAYMPTEPNIFATANNHLSLKDAQEISLDLSSQLGVQHLAGRFTDHNALSLILHKDYILLPDNIPKPQTVVQAHPEGAYYGPGYARGYWPRLAAIIEFLRYRIEGAAVWYGPDTADYCEEATPEFMATMWKYWAENGTRPYDKSFIKATS